MRKTLSLLLALVMTLALMGNLASAESTAPKATLKYLMGYTSTDPNEEPPAKKIDELTGYKVIYYNLPSEGADEKLNLELSSGAEYDIIRMTVNQFRTLAPKGALVDIAPYLENTTYLKGIMNDLEWSAAAVNGKILGIPQFDAHYVSGGIAYNVQMFEEAGFKLPEENPNRQLTLSEFVDILREVKAQHPEVIPFVGNGALAEPIASAFGIVRHDWQPDADGSIVYRFLHSKMKDYISFMHNLYTEGLIDVEWPVNKGENIDQKFTSGQAASRWQGWVCTPIVTALKDTTGADMDFLWPTASDDGLTYIGTNKGVNAFGAIPTTCKQVEAVIDFLDIRANPEVFTETFLGVEGEQWEFRNGQEYWPLLGEDHVPGFTAWFNGHYFNMVNSPESFTTLWLCRARKGEIQYSATVKTNGYPRENWVDSPLAYAPPMAAVSKYTQALNTLTNDYIVECIAGTRSVDEYDAVVAEFLAEGGQDMIDEVNAYIAEYGDMLGYSSTGKTIQDSDLLTNKGK